MFNDRVVVGPQKSFSHTDLMEYVESLLKESRLREERNLDSSNYSWLKAQRSYTPLYSEELDKMKPIVLKDEQIAHLMVSAAPLLPMTAAVPNNRMSSESCAVIAVKLDTLTGHVTPPQAILATLKHLLEEQQSSQLLEERVRRAKGTRNVKKRNRNRVHPELSPPGRLATVSFIL